MNFRTDLIADVMKRLLLPLLLMMPVIGGLIGWWFPWASMPAFHTLSHGTLWTLGAIGLGTGLLP
ncbi:hypothetical protein [Devosia sp. Naph2]|uniref:hypothetical protein n=1 Tax=Devosia polycyclovorans TaxID=3345148 RepID=UPI0035D04914